MKLSLLCNKKLLCLLDLHLLLFDLSLLSHEKLLLLLLLLLLPKTDGLRLHECATKRLRVPAETDAIDLHTDSTALHTASTALHRREWLRSDKRLLVGRVLFLLYVEKLLQLSKQRRLLFLGC